MKVQTFAPETTNPFADAAGGSGTILGGGTGTNPGAAGQASWEKAVAEAADKGGQLGEGKVAESADDLKSWQDDAMHELVDRIAMMNADTVPAERRPMAILGNSRRGLWADLVPSPATMAAWGMRQSDAQVLIDDAYSSGVESSEGPVLPGVASSTPVSTQQGSDQWAPGEVQARLVGPSGLSDLEQETAKTSYVRAQVEASLVKSPHMSASEVVEADLSMTHQAPDTVTAVREPMVDVDGIARAPGQETLGEVDWQRQQVAGRLVQGVETRSMNNAEMSNNPMDVAITRTDAPVIPPSELLNRDFAVNQSQVSNVELSGVPLVNMEAAALGLKSSVEPSPMPLPTLQSTPVNPAMDTIATRELPPTVAGQASLGQVTHTKELAKRDLNHPMGPSEVFSETRDPQVTSSQPPKPQLNLEAPPSIRPHSARLDAQSTQPASSPDGSSVAKFTTAPGEGLSATLMDESARPAMAGQAASMYRNLQDGDGVDVIPNTQVEALPTNSAQPVMASGRVTQMESQAGIQNNLMDAAQVTADEMPELPIQDLSQLDIDIDDPAGRVRLDLTREAQEIAVRLETPEEVLEDYRAMQEDIDEAIAQSGMSMSDFDAHSENGEEQSKNTGNEERHSVEAKGRAEPLKSQGSSGRLLNRIV